MIFELLLIGFLNCQDLTTSASANEDASSKLTINPCGRQPMCNSNLKCAYGSTCQYINKSLLGCCQPSYPPIPPTLPSYPPMPTVDPPTYPSDPICGGFANQKCPEGYQCIMGGSGSVGKCVKYTTPSEPTCGGFANKQCPEGYKCVYKGTGDLGQCVKQTMCGGFAGAQCPYGQTCKYLTGADYGYCY
ncbi:hypothetical protein CONCODRAFT_68538 [Conidiobolus coronatus NRRL 28638]|uniref:Carbohydrate-binding module family 18 protein n=1 Tax=Conidiobolus coronatus (strain ATCC 28846 / CBS 209.66 / NRRL 28638) TaxID=796925 RepID=A0A137PDP3_CONC2|nr:hypothetical protein CONCODRAFT_68538 [Conidiobolus coronatus NRRL 28638]|eukprot:KXN73123.1 hypothetical protein CONCODRAFT_68538 [Conidiobolus coronatus NRRL 28638]